MDDAAEPGTGEGNDTSPARERPLTPADLPDRVYTPVLAIAAGWYAAGVLLYIVWSAFFGGGGALSTCGPGLVCTTEPHDPRTALTSALPWLGLALVTSLLTAVLLRMTATTWRATTTGAAAAVIGAGLSTLVFDLLT